ncbi:MAG TPA: MFS transporter [Candidatus Dormibacteraeota bacterium]|nr:MFS transporter [Candidatus Dormibacteraeota bacterium]
MEALTATPPPVVEVKAKRPSPLTVFRSGTFRKLWSGLALSLMGDFFNYVAMAWLVLQLTGSSLALGAVLLVQAVPRSLLMLVGGAMADRLSPRVAMAGSMALRVVCIAPLAGLVLSGRVQLWEIYVASGLFGVFDAFFWPAASSILPRVVADEHLEAGNAVTNVTRQVSLIIGPALAGVVVAALGTGWAFAADAAFLAVGAAIVVWIPALARTSSAQRPNVPASTGLVAEIKAGIRYAWSDVGIRAALLIIAAVDFAANGSMNVGLPTIAHGRFGAGAIGLGVLLGAWGLGATAGAAASGMIPRPERIGWLIVAACSWIGLGIAVTGLLGSLIPAALVLAAAGVATGVINTYGVSWLQRRTDPAMQGRVMSLVMLASIGLVPISLAASGALAQLNPTILFLVAGGLIVAASAAAASSRTVRSI